MAHTATHTNFSVTESLSAVWKRFVAALFRAAESRSRVAELERLNAKSDAELAEMGLRREDIARYVFRDALYI
ncbi:hypothetical protein PSA7680_00916 [Pseudoruegeria aquimaris]|uniref:DUF1127 domain-containing protein n=1 Tax=Pseudoruegeria aquimaris TaxID=393663 RepID=A0A1Y5RQ37_9RHOB|nr:hypothetical protein [Pseudoruegeria aquimaris]SLN22755.1 hypothetical protein PSA7680_00916 [Pseudoruegeria aquimaris]